MDQRLKVILDGDRDMLSRMPNELRNAICWLLDYRSLARLSQTNYDWSVDTTPIAFHKNATEGNSSAVIWAAKGKAAGDGDSLKTNHTVLKEAVAGGCDVNAIWRGKKEGEFSTALHFAAALGRAEMVRELLELGAKVDALASGFSVFRSEKMLSMATGNELSCNGLSLYRELKRTQWLPLLLPLIRRDHAIVGQLLDAGATPRLTRQPEQAGGDDEAITAFHLMATMSESEFAEDEMHEQYVRIINNGGDHVNRIMSQDRLGPMHVAMELPNPRMLIRLLRIPGADVDVLSAVERTPLMQAIRVYTEATSSDRRRVLLKMIMILVNRGADVNAMSGVLPGESPLVCAMPTDVDEWTRAAGDIKSLVTYLINKGAVVDGVGPGPGIVHVVCERIRERGGSPSLEQLLELLLERGGNINRVAVPPGRSILVDFMHRFDQVPSGFFRKLRNKFGARVPAGEVNSAFQAWVRNPKLRSRSRGYDVPKHHGRHVSRALITSAWQKAYEHENRELHTRLLATCPPLEEASSLVEIALSKVHHAFWSYVQDLTFDASFTSPVDGKSFLHMVVTRLEMPYARESQAVRDARFFISRGTSVLLKDNEGLTALQQLRRSPNAYKDLRLVFHETRDAELGEL